jgi:hypothetical protein
MRRALLIASLLSTAVLLEFVLVPVHSKTSITYKDRPLEAWFYGAGTNFFQESTRRAAQDAIDALGTKACSFLFSNLKGHRGNGALYFKL